MSAQHAEAPAGVDRPAKPKGELPCEVPWPLFGPAAATGPVVIDPYMAMDEDTVDPAGTFTGDDAAASGAATPLWPPPDASLGDLEGWLDSLRSLPPDDAIEARAQLLESRIAELHSPPPVERASVLTRLLRAKQLTEKRRRQLRRFVDLRDGLVEEVAALRTKLVDAHSTIEATARLCTHAEEAEYKLFCEYTRPPRRPLGASPLRMLPIPPALGRRACMGGTPRLLPG